MFLRKYTEGIALKLHCDGQEYRDIPLAGLAVQISTTIGTDDSSLIIKNSDMKLTKELYSNKNCDYCFI